jgi:signal transduction histidine kinase
LRAELLDNDQTGADFTEDLDELELMVIGALQLVRDSDIHENNADVDINRLILRLIEPMLRAGHPIRFEPGQLATLSAKPLALKRALTNLIDNAIFYGKRADISVTHNEAELQVVIRDYGPGIDGDAERLFKPFSRLNHGREQREDGFGLGLNIAQHLINGHGGSLALANHEERGLVVTVRIPLA